MSKSKFRLKEGINHCTNEEYHGDRNYLSSSILKMLIKDLPRFKKEFLDGERENKQVNAFDEGNYAHSLILEPSEIPNEYAFFPGFKKMGGAWKSFKEEHDGKKIMLSKPQKHRVESWVEGYKRRASAVQLVTGGFPEYSLAGKIMDVNLKVRADYINIDKGYIADVKTTSYSPDIDSFKQVIKSLSYDLSAALYTKMFSEYYGKPFDFYFIVLGKKDSVCEVYKASDDMLATGQQMITEALNIYKKCLKTGDWTDGKKESKLVINDSNYEILEI